MVELKDKTVEELRKMASKKKIEGRSKMNKAALVRALKNKSPTKKTMKSRKMRGGALTEEEIQDIIRNPQRYIFNIHSPVQLSEGSVSDIGDSLLIYYVDLNSQSYSTKKCLKSNLFVSNKHGQKYLSDVGEIKESIAATEELLSEREIIADILPNGNRKNSKIRQIEAMKERLQELKRGTEVAHKMSVNLAERQNRTRRNTRGSQNNFFRNKIRLNEELLRQLVKKPSGLILEDDNKRMIYPIEDFDKNKYSPSTGMIELTVFDQTGARRVTDLTLSQLFISESGDIIIYNPRA